MKKLVIFSEESIFAGTIKCGIAEVVDSLAFSLVSEYEVMVVCKEGNSKPARKTTDFMRINQYVQLGQFLQVKYYLVSSVQWPNAAYSLIDELQPDIIHNFYDPRLLSFLHSRPSRSVYTFDDLGYLEDKIDFLKDYDYITTFSKGYSDLILKQDNEVIKVLRRLNFVKVSIGIAKEIFDPQRGLFIPYAYGADTLFNKEKCKQRLAEKLGLDSQDCLVLFMARLVKEKGIDNIINSISQFKLSKAKMIIIGKGEEKYEKFFNSLTKESNVLYINKSFFPAHSLSFLAGSDFYLQPSLMESGGIMPMVACQYGAIPIVTQNGGLGDNFNNDNAIIVKDSLDMPLSDAFALFADKNKLEQKRKFTMSQNFGWNSRKKYFTELYNS